MGIENTGNTDFLYKNKSRTPVIKKKIEPPKETSELDLLLKEFKLQYGFEWFSPLNDFWFEG